MTDVTYLYLFQQKRELLSITAEFPFDPVTVICGETEQAKLRLQSPVGATRRAERHQPPERGKHLPVKNAASSATSSAVTLTISCMPRVADEAALGRQVDALAHAPGAYSTAFGLTDRADRHPASFRGQKQRHTCDFIPLR